MRMWTSLHWDGCSLFLEFKALKNCGELPPRRDTTKYTSKFLSIWFASIKSNQIKFTVAGRVWCTLSKAVWSDNGSMPPAAFPWLSNSRYFYAKSSSYEYHLQKWTRILVCSSCYPTACVKVNFGLAKRAGICCVCTWSALMRTEAGRKLHGYKILENKDLNRE